MRKNLDEIEVFHLGIFLVSSYGGPKEDDPNCIFPVGDAFGFLLFTENLDLIR